MQVSATDLFTRVLPFNERKYIQMRRMNCEEYLRLPRRFLRQLYVFCETRGCLLLGRRILKIGNTTADTITSDVYIQCGR